ncbi:hydrogenase 3 maturation endopeptidase HyCI [Candidatus Omnitrophota bacterium]
MQAEFFSRLKECLGSRTAIVGIGNTLKADDGLGPLLVQGLRGKTPACLFDCGEVPENYTRPIIRSNPETIIIVDAADWSAAAGELRFIKAEEIRNFSLSTHNASLSIFLDYLKGELPRAEIIIVGVQTGNRQLMQSLSPGVEATLNQLLDFFKGCG